MTDIEPLGHTERTAIKERNAIIGKLNEVIGKVNEGITVEAGNGIVVEDTPVGYTVSVDTDVIATKASLDTLDGRVDDVESDVDDIIEDIGSNVDPHTIKGRITAVEDDKVDTPQTPPTPGQLLAAAESGTAWVDAPTGAIVDTEMSDTSINAVQNRVIKGYVDAKTRAGRFLGGWNNVTGTATNPTIGAGFVFVNGDYFRISTVGVTQQLMPYGDSYNTEASTIVWPGSETIAVGDLWIYNNGWTLSQVHEFGVDFSNLAGRPVDNPALMHQMGYRTATLSTVPVDYKYPSEKLMYDSCLKKINVTNNIGWVTPSGLTWNEKRATRIGNILQIYAVITTDGPFFEVIADLSQVTIIDLPPASAVIVSGTLGTSCGAVQTSSVNLYCFTPEASAQATFTLTLLL